MDDEQSSFFTASHRALQDRFETSRLADRLESEDIVNHLGDWEREFVQSSRMFFLTTIDHNGQPTVSYKGGNPGFVKVLGNRLMAFPSYNGNGMYYSTGNIGQNQKVGMLFIDFEKPRRLRIHGDASVSLDDPLLAEFPGAQFIVHVRVRQAFDNCPRYIHRMKLIELSKYVPSKDGSAPRPAWKRLEYVQDVLTEEDRTQTQTEGGPLSMDDYMTQLDKGEA
jgi:predicted pyridoxine 5'-phosphate oxidase superfamily flavin-nucleotide-binding protein